LYVNSLYVKSMTTFRVLSYHGIAC